MKHLYFVFSNSSTEFTLGYKLLNQRLGDFLLSSITQFSTDDMCKVNYISGVPDTALIAEKINELHRISAAINSVIPFKIPDFTLTIDNYQITLNALHTHFPELSGTHFEQILSYEIKTFNDLIHWLEHAFRALSSESLQSMRISIDFNKCNLQPPNQIMQLELDEYALFDVVPKFCSLLFGYAHVGRHASELLRAYDLTCPSHQFVPQTRVYPSVWFFLHEIEDAKRDERRRLRQSEFDAYYQIRGQDFFGLARDDPRLAFGHLVIGELISIQKNGTCYNIPTLEHDMRLLKQELLLTKIDRWYSD